MPTSKAPFAYLAPQIGRRKKLKRGTELKDLVVSSWKRTAVVGAHDDDIALMAGMLIHFLRAQKIEVCAAVVTDGRQGYCDLDEKTSIVKTRKKETRASFECLNVTPENVQFMNFPDCILSQFAGRRLVTSKKERRKLGKIVECGAVGLQNSMTRWLRAVRPDVVIVPHGVDYHPDHTVVYNELMISICHASGTIWPELGPPLEREPAVMLGAVYVDFDGDPNFAVQGGNPSAAFESKLNAIRAFESQKQIGELVKRVTEAGAQEYFQVTPFRRYDARSYTRLFAE